MADYTQKNRPMRLVSSPLAEDTLLLERLRATEHVSQPFELTLDLLSTDPNVDADALLRQPVVVALDTSAGTPRFFHGLVRRFVQFGRDADFTVYRAEVVPALWFLSLSADCRIFQTKSVPDIVRQVLSDFGISDVRVSLTGTYPARDYCVQYRETHLDFISRLLEEEGIFYFFEHTDSKHTLVLADATSAVKAGIVGKLDATALAGETPEGDTITALELETQVYSNSVTLVDYNDTMPKRLQSTTAASPQKASGAKLDLFDYPGKFAAVTDGDRLARVRMEEREARRLFVAGQTNCTALGSGQKLEISGHYRRDVNQPYHLLSVEQRAYVSTYRTVAAKDSVPFEFTCAFTAIPYSVIYHPPRVTPKAMVYGSQTAVVVGPSGEEIYVDKYGRVKLQFFWDQLGQSNDKSSCWVRVSSTWAGKGWGFIQVPRIGQEVIVDFLEGDPDRPIITGRVYNAEQMPPYTLPDNGTQSGLKTRSSKGGAASDANELRFEDKKGSEQVFFHAQKDLASTVENDETRDVKHDRTTTIKNDETKTITDGNETVTIAKGNQTLTVSQGNQTVTIGQGSQTVTVSEGDQTITVDKGKQTITIDQNRDVVIRQGSDSLTVKMGTLSTEVSQGNHATQVKMGNVTLSAGLGSISYDAMKGIELKVGQNSVKIDPSGVTIQGMKVSIQGQTQTEVKGLMTTVNASGILTMKGSMTMIN